MMAAAGILAGGLGLAWIEHQMHVRRPRAPMAGGSVDAVAAPGRSSSQELARMAERASLTLGMLIAVAIGLHNFSEGLAIGVSARAGEVALATTLIIGFALHNATEGFGIVGPLGSVRPSWRWLFLAGLVGGGPTFAGTLVGYRVTSPALEISFYTLAAGRDPLRRRPAVELGQPPPRRAARALRPHARLPDRARVRPRHHLRRRLSTARRRPPPTARWLAWNSVSILPPGARRPRYPSGGGCTGCASGRGWFPMV